MLKQKIGCAVAGEKITFEQKIAKTIVHLLDNGMKPTNRNIAMHCGGSFSSIAPVLKKLKTDYQAFTKIEQLCRDFSIKRENNVSLLKENKELKNQLESLNKKYFSVCLGLKCEIPERAAMCLKNNY